VAMLGGIGGSEVQNTPAWGGLYHTQPIRSRYLEVYLTSPLSTRRKGETWAIYGGTLCHFALRVTYSLAQAWCRCPGKGLDMSVRTRPKEAVSIHFNGVSCLLRCRSL
jgi:hypothetical protein